MYSYTGRIILAQSAYHQCQINQVNLEKNKINMFISWISNTKLLQYTFTSNQSHDTVDVLNLVY